SQIRGVVALDAKVCGIGAEDLLELTLSGAKSSSDGVAVDDRRHITLLGTLHVLIVELRPAIDFPRHRNDRLVHCLVLSLWLWFWFFRLGFGLGLFSSSRSLTLEIDHRRILLRIFDVSSFQSRISETGRFKFRFGRIARPELIPTNTFALHGAIDTVS